MSSCGHQHHNIEAAADISFPEIFVNENRIESELIAQEMQYHPANTAEEALIASVQSLVIKQLLKDEINKHDLADSTDGNEELAVSRLLELRSQPTLATEAECQQYYQSNQQRFMTDPLIAARHILFPAAPDDVEARDLAKKNAEMVLQRLIDNINEFADLAKQYSACPSKETGGALGQLSKGQTTPEFERQIFSLEEGLSQQLIESRYGFHVVDIEKKVAGDQLPFDAVEHKIGHFLNEISQRKSITEYIRSLIDKAEIDGIEKEALSPSFNN